MVERIRRQRDDFNLTTDIIVGFPGETEEEFAASREMVRELGFSHVHTFPYSLRSGTRAARMSGQVSTAVKTRRAAEIRRLAGENKRRYRASLIGARQRVLVERPDPAPDREHGYGEHYVPVRIRPPAGAPKPVLEHNHFYTVEISAVSAEGEDPTGGDEAILQGVLR
jgi:threonylcarbamoyladenosine tRNA methylthiotransferase MtaB